MHDVDLGVRYRGRDGLTHLLDRLGRLTDLDDHDQVEKAFHNGLLHIDHVRTGSCHSCGDVRKDTYAVFSYDGYDCFYFIHFSYLLSVFIISFAAGGFNSFFAACLAVTEALLYNESMVNIGNDWDRVLAGEFDKEYYQELRKFLIWEYRNRVIYPDMYDIFNALKLTPYEDVKAVILGQDPYHEQGQAHGLAFSVQKGVQQPPSLMNIFKELHDDLGILPPPQDNGCLIPWAQQGVLLLNTCLTVREHQAGSHRGKGWETLTDRIIELLNQREKPMVFILWGANAKAKQALITDQRHLVLSGPHPSPLSAYRGFFGGRYFSKTNEFLIRVGQEPINWQLD